MNTLITHFMYTLRQAWAERKVSLLRIGQFFLATLILGFAFSSVVDTQDFDAIDIAYATEEDSPAAQQYVEALVEMDAFAGIATFHEVDSFEQGRAAVQDDDYGAFIYLPEGFQDQVTTDGDQAVVEVYSELYSGMNYLVVSSVVDGFNNGANASYAAQSLDQRLVAENLGEKSLSNVSVAQGREMTALTYYAVSMLLFMMLYGTEYGAFGIGAETVGTMTMRSRLAPQRPWQLLVGKLAAYSLVLLTMAGIFMVTTWLFLGMTWGQNIGLVLLIVYLFGLLSLALGMLFVVLTRDEAKVNPLINVAVIGFTFLAGGFIAVNFGGLEYISPNLYARNALCAAIFGDNADSMWTNIGILAGVTAVLIAIDAIAARRKVTA